MGAEVVIVGGGPAGCVAAMSLSARGVHPVIVEREAFPRYHIGESMTAEAGRIMRDLGLADRMAELGCPIKHGVCVTGPSGGTAWWVPVMRRTPEGLRPNTTWQVRRSAFDAMLLEEAEARGATVVRGRAATPRYDGDAVVGVDVETDDGPLEIDARMTLDCSGQATFLARQKATGPKYLGSYDKQIAIFSQVSGFRRDHGEEPEQQPGNTHIFYKAKYHWAWAIPLDAETQSVGVVVPAQSFKATGETKREFLTRELAELNPGLAGRVGTPTFVEDVHIVPNYSFQVRSFTGRGFICVGDAHRFVDPIFSFGMNISMQEAVLAAEVAASVLEGAPDSVLRDHAVRVETATDILEDVLDAFWENPLAFATFVHSRYRMAMIDCFAGRIYGELTDEQERAIAAFRRLLGRERTYDGDDDFSIPIGSRFHPERAPLWDAAGDAVATTERWMRD